jgi:hypothetical protein
MSTPPKSEHCSQQMGLQEHAKCKQDGSIERFKAWLVAKGFDQRIGVELTETFSLVIKSSTIRVVLAFQFTSIGVFVNWTCRMLFFEAASLKLSLWSSHWVSLMLLIPTMSSNYTRLYMASNKPLGPGSLAYLRLYLSSVFILPLLIPLFLSITTLMLSYIFWSMLMIF